MTRLYTTAPVLQASVLDWIPARYHDRIRANTVSGPDDVSSYVEAAMNECGAYELVVEPGTLAISRQLTITNTSLSIRSRGTLLLTANIPSALGGREAMLYFNQVRPTIDGLAFNCGSFDGNAIYCASITTPSFKNISISNTKAGYAGIRGGAILYGQIERLNVGGAGRSVDFQKGWEYRNPMTGSPTLTFVSAGVGLGGTITRSAGSWITDGYSAADEFVVEKSTSNNGGFTVSSRTATVLTLTAGTLVNEGPTSGCLVMRAYGNYYGYHAGTIERSILGAGEGCRLHGFTKLVHTDHEHAVVQPALRNEKASLAASPLCAAVVMGEEISPFDANYHQYEFHGIYMELSEGTALKQRAFASVYAGNVVKFNGGLVYGQTGPSAGSVGIYNCLVQGGGGTECQFNRWEYGYEGAFSGGGGHSGVMDLSGVLFANTTTLFKAGTGVQLDQMNRTWGHWTDIHYQRDIGLVQGPQVAHVVHQITPDTGANKIDTALGRHWYLTAVAPLTLGSTYFVTANISSGQEGFFTFHDGNITLDDSFLNLRGGANRAFAAGESFHWYVDTDGIIREMGY